MTKMKMIVRKILAPLGKDLELIEKRRLELKKNLNICNRYVVS